MNVEKVIRILGYIVYVALWSPIIVLFMLVAPIVLPIIFMRIGMTLEASIKLFVYSLKAGIQHDAEFIRTGKWY
jgi:hypothetical protein